MNTNIRLVTETSIFIRLEDETTAPRLINIFTREFKKLCNEHNIHPSWCRMRILKGAWKIDRKHFALVNRWLEKESYNDQGTQTLEKDYTSVACGLPEEVEEYDEWAQYRSKRRRLIR